MNILLLWLISVSPKAPALEKGHTQITNHIGATLISHFAQCRGRLTLWESETQQQTLSFIREMDHLLLTHSQKCPALIASGMVCRAVKLTRGLPTVCFSHLGKEQTCASYRPWEQPQQRQRLIVTAGVGVQGLGSSRGQRARACKGKA